MPGGDYVAENVAWIRIDDASSPGTARRHAVHLAHRLEFGESRAAEVGIAVTEMTQNQLRHAQNGTVLVRGVRSPTEGGVQVIGVDAGPGMADAVASARDGTSTAGTLGIGLGAIMRLADGFDIYSSRETGTVLTATFWAERRTRDRTPADGLTRPMTGEDVCGDAFATRQEGDCLLVLSCDGLGHGPLAALAASEAVRVFAGMPAGAQPIDVVRALHRGLSHTRGAAVAVARWDPGAGELRYSGLGNISGWVVAGGVRSGLLTHYGIAGHQARTIRETVYPLSPDAVMILHSDGISDRWDHGRYPGLLGRSPLVIAAAVLRDAGVRRDDASVVVAKAS